MSNFINSDFINNLFKNTFQGFSILNQSNESRAIEFYTSDLKLFKTSNGMYFCVREE